jgi:hypothetical protein
MPDSRDIVGVFVITDEIVKQATKLRESLEKVAMDESTNKLTANWIFSLCETLGELEN